MSASPGGRRRILFLLPFAPHLGANHGGGRVVSQLVCGLAERHDVAAIYLRNAGEPTADDALRERLVRVDEIAVSHDVSFAKRMKRRTASLRGIPAWAAYTDFPAVDEKLREVVETWRPEILQFEYHVMGQYADALPDHSAVRVLSVYEAGVVAAREHLATDRDGDTLGSALQRRAWEQFERRVMANMDAVVVVSDRDRDALVPLAGDTPIVRIGFVSPVPSEPFNSLGADDPAEVVFVGNFAHPPNVDAAEWLVSEIFPRVRRRVPGVLLRIVGANATPSLLAARDEQIDVTGEVPDVQPFMDRASVIVVPLRLGAGMRVKVVEALAGGKAVVATPRAIEGLAVDHGTHLVVAEDAQQIATEVVRLLESADARVTLARDARAWAVANLSQERWLDEYDALYASLTERRLRA